MHTPPPSRGCHVEYQVFGRNVLVARAVGYVLGEPTIIPVAAPPLLAGLERRPNWSQGVVKVASHGISRDSVSQPVGIRGQKKEKGMK